MRICIESQPLEGNAVNPKRYGVIDIRVWKLLFTNNLVRKNPKGVNFTFNQWNHAKELGVSVRTVERTLFHYHRKNQTGILYAGK